MKAAREEAERQRLRDLEEDSDEDDDSRKKKKRSLRKSSMILEESAKPVDGTTPEDTLASHPVGSAPCAGCELRAELCAQRIGNS